MQIGTGASVTFDGTAIGEVIEIRGPSISRVSIEASHLGTTGAHEFLPGVLYDPGELRLTIGLDTCDVPELTDPCPKEVIIEFRDGTTWTTDGFITGWEATIPLEDKMTAEMTIKLTSDLVVDCTSASPECP